MAYLPAGFGSAVGNVILAGAVIGGVIGWASQSERWHPIQSRATHLSIGLAPVRRGAMASLVDKVLTRADLS